jgi:hypothetical protein
MSFRARRLSAANVSSSSYAKKRHFWLIPSFPSQLSPQINRHRSGSGSDSNTDVLYFGVSGDKGAHMVLRFDFELKKLMQRDADKGT